MSARATAVPIGVCLAASLALAGCSPAGSGSGSGSRASSASSSAAASEPYGDKTPEEIHDLAYSTTRAATFKKLRGTMNGGMTQTFEYSFVNADCAGVQSADPMGRTEFQATSEAVYVKRDAKAWRVALEEPVAREDAVVARAADRWVKFGAGTEDAESIAGSCGFADPAVLLQKEAARITRGASATVDGQPAFTLTYPGWKGSTVTEYIAAQGRPYLLKRTETGGSLPSEITYYDFETVNQLRPPADGEAIAFDGI
ncbi:hypothetical protein [Streptomyces globosus]|uniref:hypothetical protein n=1 Tax=Streptomyces globosus TaxID=68209 RepID=UPI0031D3039B